MTCKKTFKKTQMLTSERQWYIEKQHKHVNSILINKNNDNECITCVIKLPVNTNSITVNSRIPNWIVNTFVIFVNNLNIFTAEVKAKNI